MQLFVSLPISQLIPCGVFSPTPDVKKTGASIRERNRAEQGELTVEGGKFASGIDWVCSQDSGGTDESLWRPNLIKVNAYKFPTLAGLDC